MDRRVRVPAWRWAALAAFAAVAAAALAGLVDRLVPSSHPSGRTVVAHVAVVYVVLLVGLRTLGKRELTTLSPFELVTLLLIPEIVSGAMVGEASLPNALVGVCTLLVLVFANSLVAYRFPRLSSKVERDPTVLVAHGKLVTEGMQREQLEPEELFAEMHKNGLEDLSQVKWAILEPEGDLTFIRADGEAPEPAHDDGPPV